MKSRQFTLGLMAFILIQLISFKAVAQCCVIPENLTIKEVPFGCAITSWDLQWERIQKAGCTIPLKYKVQYRRAGDSGWATIIVTTAQDATVGDTIIHFGYIRPLCTRIYYEWRVKGICSDTNKTTFVYGPNFFIYVCPVGYPCFQSPVTTSSASAASSEGKFTVTAYPNPVAGELKLSGHLKAGGIVNIQIINSVGQTVLRWDHNFNSGDFNTGIDVSKLPPEVYVVIVNDNTERTALSIIKQ
jgi:hypothetical protein